MADVATCLTDSAMTELETDYTWTQLFCRIQPFVCLHFYLLLPYMYSLFTLTLSVDLMRENKILIFIGLSSCF